ncbi:MAG: OmpA family protein, partial [Polyangia bacterium]
VLVGLAWAPSSGGRGAVASPSADADGDGVPDAQDLCPTEPEDRDGFPDDDGCPDPDNDGDGIPDAADRCPNEPEDRDLFRDDDGCPDPDNDGDGIPDAQDRCPNEAEDRDVFEDDDGCPDLDNDGDGIPDAADRCPNEPETRNGIDDDDGCPDSGSAVAADSGALHISDHLFFASGETTVPARLHALLGHIADRINAHREIVRVRIEGHADDLGSPRVNAAVAQARAVAVRDYLIERGVAPERLQAVGYAGTRPLDRRKTGDARARNRRVEFVVVESNR